MTLILPIFGERKKGKLHILKKVGLSTFKDMLKKNVYNSTVIFFNVLLLCLKGYSETLKALLKQRENNVKQNHINPFMTEVVII